MKRFRFRLDTVLRVRRLEQQQAEGHLFDAGRRLVEAEQQLGVLEQRLLVSGRAPRPTAAAALQADWALRQGHVDAVAQQRRQVVLAEQERESARLRWVVQAAKVGALERLEARHRVLHDAQVRHAEAVLLDELVTSRHGRLLSGSVLS